MSGHHASAEDPFADLIRSGDPESIARALHPAVRGFVRAYLFTADPDLIETATSESLLAMCRYRHTFRGRARAWAWIRRITVREAARCAKREARARPPGTLPIDHSWPVSIVEPLAREAPSMPSEAFADLRARIPNPAWRRIWLLWHEPGARRTHEEIARLTGYTPGSVAVILSRVRSLLNGTGNRNARPRRSPTLTTEGNQDEGGERNDGGQQERRKRAKERQARRDERGQLRRTK